LHTLASVTLISVKLYYRNKQDRASGGSDRTIDFTEKREIMEDEREEKWRCRGIESRM